MALPEFVRRRAEQEIRAYCELRNPAEMRDEMRLEYELRGNSITIVDRRAPWEPGTGPEWTSLDLAQLRYDESSSAWTLWWKRADGRWYRYQDAGPTGDLSELIRTIDEDIDGVFWG